MIYSKIELMQIEKSDVPQLRSLLNTHGANLSDHRELTDNILNDQYDQYFTNSNCYNFWIRGFREGEFKLSIIGFCAISSIDWVSRHAQLEIIMHGDGSGSTIPYSEVGSIVFDKVLEFAFDEIALQKIWIEIFDGNEIKSILEMKGFVAEGVRRKAKFKNGKFIDTTICSMLVQEYKGKA